MKTLIGKDALLFYDTETCELLVSLDKGKNQTVIAGINGKDGKDGKDGINGKNGTNGKDSDVSLSGLPEGLLICNADGTLGVTGYKILNDGIDINAKTQNAIATYNALRLLIRPLIKRVETLENKG